MFNAVCAGFSCNKTVSPVAAQGLLLGYPPVKFLYFCGERWWPVHKLWVKCITYFTAPVLVSIEQCISVVHSHASHSWLGWLRGNPVAGVSRGYAHLCCGKGCKCTRELATSAITAT